MKLKILFSVSIISVALFVRVWHIDFGLPQTFPADEQEIAEVAILHTFELKNVIRNNDVYKLIPVSYVYGTFPAYLFTFFDLIFVKFNNIIGHTFSKYDLYVFMRLLNAGISLILIPLGVILFKKLFGNNKGAMTVAFLTALNWKFIVHAHYLNSDLILAVLTMGSMITAYYYYRRNSDTLFTVLTGILLGFSIGTKVTAAIIIPAFIYLYLSKRDLKSLAGLLITAAISFIISNPFSIIFFKDFIFRVFLMGTKEAGLVFDSVDYSPFKYLSALSYILTPVILAVSAHGIFLGYKKTEKKTFLNFLMIIVSLYLVFYSVQSRRVDRWMLPIVPILIVFAGHGIFTIVKKLSKSFYYQAAAAVCATGIVLYMGYPSVLLLQFQRQTPKSAAYLWAKDNLPVTDLKYVITEEGQDPFTKMLNTNVHVFNVYESKGAYLSFPDNPELYNYVILSSRPLNYFKKAVIQQKYPFYYKTWENFENEVRNSGDFKLIKSFKTTNPNLVPLSEVDIYQRL